MQQPPFALDERLVSSCFALADWPLSRVLLKNNADYPWLILVPRVDNIQEIDQLPKQLRYQLIDEISQLSSITRAHFKPNKLNMGALGNIVAQLHIHVVARFTYDKLWPHGIWQAAQTTVPYDEETLNSLLEDLRSQLNV